MEYVIGTIIAVALVLLCFFEPAPNGEDLGGASVTTHRLYGKYRVLYPDGQISQPFDRSTARDYASMFGGKVIPK